MHLSIRRDILNKIAMFLVLFVGMTQILLADSVYYNYKKESPLKNSQINLSSLDMKNLTEVDMTFVGLEFNAQGWADFVSIEKPVVLYASSSTDLRVKYKNRPSYEYDSTINNKAVHLKAKNYFYWQSYFQIVLAPDKKYGSKLRSKFNGIENTLSSYIVEKGDPARTFKFNKRVENRKETIDATIASELPEIPSALKYCSDNLIMFKYNIHFGSGKPLFGRGKSNEVKEVVITLYAVLHSLTFANGTKVSYKTAEKPKVVENIKTTETKNTKNKSKFKSKSKGKSKSKSNNKTASKNAVAQTKEEIQDSSAVSDILGPRTDSELDDDLGAEVVFVTGAADSLKYDTTSAPRSDSELNSDLGGN